MAICPVANSIGCKKCAVVRVCVLRSVLGNYGEKPKVDPEADTEDVSNDPPES